MNDLTERARVALANQCCEKCGKKWGEYVAGISSVWYDTCDICLKYKPVTSVRDFNYLRKRSKAYDKTDEGSNNS